VDASEPATTGGDLEPEDGTRPSWRHLDSSEKLVLALQYTAAAVAMLAIVAGLVLTVVIGIRLFNAGTPNPHVSPLNNIFASRIVIFAVRVAIVFAALYAVVATVALLAERRWPTQVGPVQISESVRALRKERNELRRLAAQAGQEIEQLQDQLTEANSVIDDQREDLELALRHISRLSRQKDATDGDD
jgi:hypothetical protein